MNRVLKHEITEPAFEQHLNFLSGRCKEPKPMLKCQPHLIISAAYSIVFFYYDAWEYVLFISPV